MINVQRTHNSWAAAELGQGGQSSVDDQGLSSLQYMTKCRLGRAMSGSYLPALVGLKGPAASKVETVVVYST